MTESGIYCFCAYSYYVNKFGCCASSQGNIWRIWMQETKVLPRSIFYLGGSFL